MIQRPSDKQDCLRISTPAGHLPPPAATEEPYKACEEAYGACEESFRDAHGPFDVFQSLMDDTNSEPDQHPQNEFPADLKEAIQDFLRALRVNLMAINETGLELDELCPYAVYGDVCVDRVVLLSALRDGIVRIDDSEGKRLWRPGPNWPSFQKVLLSQYETDAMPS
ncbi:MAG TPA: hypothetical protein VKN18_10940 [Blastocatellia bacterium]|nr:hypothetical protein [Blastocatellia bacterium]